MLFALTGISSHPNCPLPHPSLCSLLLCPSGTHMRIHVAPARLFRRLGHYILTCRIKIRFMVKNKVMMRTHLRYRSRGCHFTARGPARRWHQTTQRIRWRQGHIVVIISGALTASFDNPAANIVLSNIETNDKLIWARWPMTTDSEVRRKRPRCKDSMGSTAGALFYS